MIGMEFEQPVKEIRSRLIHEQKVFTGASGTMLSDYYLSASAKQKQMNSHQIQESTLTIKMPVYRLLFRDYTSIYLYPENLPTVLSNETTSQNKVPTLM